MPKYSIIRVVGEGSSAVSYLAIDENGKKVIIKRYKTAVYKQKKHYQRECSILYGLKHPQIPSYLDSYLEKIEHRTLPHVVQEYIDAISLQDHVLAHTPSMDEIANWLEQLLDIFIYLQNLCPPVIHRDIKPSNILILDNRIYLIDFGLAIYDQLQTLGHSVAVGTLGYQAPEQLHGEPTIQSDIYSLGVLAVQLYTGISPIKMLDGIQLKWRDKCRRLPHSLQIWLESMLSHDLSKRYKNAREAMMNHPHIAKRNGGIFSPDMLNDSSSSQIQYLGDTSSSVRKDDLASSIKRSKIDSVLDEKMLQAQLKSIKAELEAVWDQYVYNVQNKNILPADAIQEMFERYKDISPILVGDGSHYITHPIFLFITFYSVNKHSVGTLAYRRWIIRTKCKQNANNQTIQNLRSAIREKKKNILRIRKGNNKLGIISKVLLSKDAQQELLKSKQELKNLEVILKNETSKLIKSNLKLYWQPWFDDTIEGWVQKEVTNFKSWLSDYLFLIKLGKQRRKYERSNRTKLIQKKNLEDILSLQENSWSRIYKTKPSTFELVNVPAGFFRMGALIDDAKARERELPAHEVRLTKGLYVSKFPTTQELYAAVVGENPSFHSGDTHPVENVSWRQAVIFCNRLSEIEGLEPAYQYPLSFVHQDMSSKLVTWNSDADGYRLPTEAEWEYCARSWMVSFYAGGNNLDEYGWFGRNVWKNDQWFEVEKGNSQGRTHPVGQKKPNDFGLYDMSGNVFEWVWDSWIREYKSSVTDPVYEESTCDYRVYRGGSWNYGSSYARISSRRRNVSNHFASYIGFRIVRWAQ